MRTLLVGFLVFAGCASSVVSLELVQSAPIETSLHDPALADAHLVWLQMIDQARATIDFEEFYAANNDTGRLTPIIDALTRAGARGVRIRMLFDAGFYAKDPTTVDRLGTIKNVEVRHSKPPSGGIIHAKFFVVDGRQAFVGSQNFDWRSLEHIQELGVKISGGDVPAQLDSVFASDWKGEWHTPPGLWASPQSLATNWELPHLVALIDGAQKNVHVQLLTYNTHQNFNTLDDALKRAKARGVEVELIVSDWCKKPALESLAQAGVQVKMVTIPEWSGGAIPYARVVHAKYMVVDGVRGWLGTSNWDYSYFFKDRNVGLAMPLAQAQQLETFFQRNYNAPYAKLIEVPAAVQQLPSE